MFRMYQKFLFILVVIFCVLSPLQASGDWVSVDDFQIGSPAKPSPLKSQRVSAETLETGHVRVRELVSLATGERGASVPSRGLLTDVVWAETIVPVSDFTNGLLAEADAVQERIIYYGFNVGRWQYQLTADTSVLTRAFMTQPMLVLLNEDDKATIAETLVRSPDFSQAVEHYEAYAQGVTTGYSILLLDDLIEALGEQGLSQVTEPQLRTTRERFRVKAERIQGALSSGAINFDDSTQSFEVFSGMDVSGERTTTTGEPSFRFESWSSLTYGVQPIRDFNNVTGDFFEDGERHFLKAPLLKPVVGFFGNGHAETTSQKVSKYPALEAVGGSERLVIYRNNPNTALDAPMAVNLIVTGAIIVEATVGTAAFFNPKAIKKYFKKVKAFTENIEPYVEWIGLVYTLGKSAHELMCTVVDETEGLCGDLSKSIDRAVEVAGKLGLGAILKTTKDTIGTELKDDEFNASGYCAGIVLDVFKGKIKKTDRLSKTKKGDGVRAKTLVCAFDLLVTKPVLAYVKKYLPGTYESDFKGVNSLRITADHLKRSNTVKMKIRGSQRIKSKQRLTTAVASLFKSPVGFSLSKNTLGGVGQVFSVSNDAVGFASDVLKGEVKWRPLGDNLFDAAVDAMQEAGKGALADAFFTIAKSLTPAKTVQLANTVGNKGGKLMWDWMTDPAMVKLNLKRVSDSQVNVSHKIPEMAAIRYLAVPVGSNKLLHSTSIGVHYEAKNKAFVCPLATSSEANNFLVLSGFKASVENQTAFKDEDKPSIKALIQGERVKLRWNVKKLENSAINTRIPLKSRNAGDFNNKAVVVKHSVFPWTNSVVGLDEELVVNQRVFKDLNMDDYQAIDFSEVYTEQLGGSDGYALYHVTPGIFSDYTHFQINTPTEAKTYSNQMTMYVLKNLRGLQSNLQANSRRYEAWEAGKFKGVGEIQLRFNHNKWSEVGLHGLWAVWRQVKNSKVVWTTPVNLGVISTGDQRVLAYPENIKTGSAQLFVYEDTLHGYLNNTHVSDRNVFNTLNNKTTETSAPFVRVTVSGLKKTASSLLQVEDQDHDGIPNHADAFPQDARYQHDTDGDGMADTWEQQHKLAIFNRTDAVKDPDDDDYSNLDEFLADTNPRDNMSFPNLVDLRKGLVAHYEFEDDISDSTEYQNHGVTETILGYETGVIGKAVHLNGEGDYLRVLNDDQINLTSLSLSVWAKTKGFVPSPSDLETTPHQIIFHKEGQYEAGIFGSGIDHSYLEEKEISFAYGDRWTWLDTNVYATANRWKHYVVNISPTSAQLYIDGVLVKDITVSKSVSKTTNDLLIGARDNGSVYTPRAFFKGWIDDFRIYSRALSDDEVSSLYLLGDNEKLVKLLGASEQSEGQSIIADSEGNIYVAGIIGDSLFDGKASYGGTDVLIAKYDESGSRLWTRRLGGSSSDRSYSIGLTATNSIIVSGITDSFDFDGHHYNVDERDSEVFVAAYDTNGKKLWSRLLGGTNSDYFNDATFDSSGNIYITGSSDDNYEGIVSQADLDVFVTKLGADGTVIWSQFIGGSSWELPHDIKVDLAGNIYITGATYTVNFDSETKNHKYDSFLLKLNPDGSKSWVKTIGTEGDDVASAIGHSINLSTDNKVHVVGFSDGPVFDGHSLTYGGDYFTLEFDKEGDKISSNTLGIGNPSNSYAVFGEDNKIYVVTNNYLNHFEGYSSLGLNDIYVVKFDSTGKKLLTKQFGGSGNDYVSGKSSGEDHGNGIFVSGNGMVYLTGYTQNLYGDNQFEGLDNDALYGYDMFLIRHAFRH